MKIRKDHFGKLRDGSQLDLFIIENDKSKIKLTNYGAAIVSLQVPDKNNNSEEITLGFDNPLDYEQIRSFYGAVVGRYGNRIAKGKFTLDGREYSLAVNEGENHLHGGVKGFDRVVWKTEEIVDGANPGVTFSYLSKDREEGYPGNLNVRVSYSFNDNLELMIKYEIDTDKPTVKNITNHAYYNLSGNLKKDILSHVVRINAEKFLPVTQGLIPTGELRCVSGTPMDFKEPHQIGERINDDDIQLKYGKGYDHNWIIKGVKNVLKYAATIEEPESGRVMEVFTTEPGLQFYSGNFMDGSHAGHNGKVYKYRYAIVLETQHYPNSPNQGNFPTTVLRPGESYESKTIYKFSVKR
jgi:aldose 1-epimerase